MRDYFCSKISKGAHCYHPVDFVVLSGILSAQHQLSLVDAVIERLDFKGALDAVRRCNPDVIIFLTGVVSFEDDGPFLSEVARLTNARMIGLGDVFLESPEKIFDLWHWLDAVLLDFTTDDVLRLVADQLQATKNAIVRMGDGRVVSFPIVHEKGDWALMTPLHELFLSLNYSFPFSRRNKFATVLTNFGCPYACDYCTVSRFAYKERAVEDLQLEFNKLQDLGIKEIFFKDQAFGTERKRILKICDELSNRNVPFGWTCFLRPELADPIILEKMALAGCHTIIFGVESGDEVVRSIYRREYTDRLLKDIFSLCRHFGIETVATFMMGLPGETRTSLEKTIRLAKALECDYASFNVFVPAYGTSLRRRLIADGIIPGGFMFMDSGVSRPCFSTDSLNADVVWSMRNKALAEFYARPSFLIKMILKAGSFSRLLCHLKEGWAIMMSRGSI